MGVGFDAYPSFLVYGPYGAGLSTALKTFRELGFLTVSGMAYASVERHLLMAQTEDKPLAIAPELNPHEVTPTEVASFFQDLKSQYPALKLLYLSTPTEVLLQRFAAADKRHPYEQSGLRDAIEQEQQLYKALKPLSDYHVDTSTTTERELALKVAKILNIDMGTQPMTVHLVSFGFKNGVPTDAEMVFDMRFLPNPFYEEHLRPMTGMDAPVRDYVFGFPQTGEFLAHWQNLLAQSLPHYQAQGKTRMTIAIGCTGGQHRSVAMTLALAQYLQQAFPDFVIQVRHREQNHWPQQTAAPQC